MWWPRPPISKLVRHCGPYLVYSWYNGPHNHHTEYGVRPHVTCWDSRVCPRTLSFSVVSLYFGFRVAVWNLYPLWLTPKFYKAGHIWKGPRLWNKVLEIKVKNGKFKRDKLKNCTFPYCTGADTFWALSSTLIPVAVGQGHGALRAGTARAETEQNLFNRWLLSSSKVSSYWRWQIVGNN